MLTVTHERLVAYINTPRAFSLSDEARLKKTIELERIITRSVIRDNLNKGH